ncbi:MAG: 2Fe-2S iron-sulfur cluster-binding protein, partial [Caldimonas sp.]
MSTRPIQFFHRGAIVEVSDASPTRTVLDWLREDARCTGTKEGCNEGDCGACTTVIGELAAPGDPDAVRGLALRTVNACIQFLPTLDGKALFTVEDLKTIQAAAVSDAPAPAASQPSTAHARPVDAAPLQTVHAAHAAQATSHGTPHDPLADLHPVQRAMVDCHGSQCGFCTPGFVMSLWSTYE